MVSNAYYVQLYIINYCLRFSLVSRRQTDRGKKKNNRKLHRCIMCLMLLLLLV